MWPLADLCKWSNEMIVSAGVSKLHCVTIAPTVSAILASVGRPGPFGRVFAAVMSSAWPAGTEE
jgi:hypothetical protein